eukprot:g20905.t1
MDSELRQSRMSDCQLAAAGALAGLSPLQSKLLSQRGGFVGVRRSLARGPSCCARWGGAPVERSQNDVELEEALSTALAQVDKRVWVGIRLRPHDRHDGAENCLQVDRRQIVQTLGPASRVNFFFDEIFKEDTRQEDGVAFRALGHEETEYVSATMVHECPSLCTLAGEREELEPGSAYKAPILSAEERVVVRGLTRRRCDPGQLTQQVGSWLVEGAASRMVGKTVFNPRSSRSHAVATIHICWNDMPDQKKGNETRVYIVDLAGSERSGQYATNTEQLREGSQLV